MKKILLPLITATLLCTGCNSKTQVQQPKTAAQNQSAQQLSDVNEAEKYDTSDCKAWFQLIPITGSSWDFITIKPLLIKDGFKPIVKVTLSKMVMVTTPYEDLDLHFEIDTQICVDQESHITFTFEDKTAFSLTNIDTSNCKGELSGGFLWIINHITQEENEVELKIIQMLKIHSIRFTTKTGHRDYVLSDIESTNLLALIKYAHKLKDKLI